MRRRKQSVNAPADYWTPNGGESANRMGLFETEVLIQPHNPEPLARLETYGPPPRPQV